MKKTIFLLSYLFFGAILFGQIPKGTVVVDALYSKNLENTQGENPTRQVSIYLPPDYATSTKSYPVIYYLHGFLGDHQLRPSMIAVLDQAIADHKMRPFILVVPNQKTKLRFSFDYKFLGLFISYSPNFYAKDESTYGETKTLDLSFKFFYNDRLRQEVDFKNTRGFYVENPIQSLPLDIYPQLEIRTIGGKTFYIMNNN